MDFLARVDRLLDNLVSARDHVGRAHEQIVDERRALRLLAKLALDQRGGPGALAAVEQQIDEHAVSTIGRHASRRGVRLVHVSGVLKLREGRADGRRRDTQPALGRNCLRRHRLAGLDVFADGRRQQAASAIG
jgi:hypothetical protein